MADAVALTMESSDISKPVTGSLNVTVTSKSPVTGPVASLVTETVGAVLSPPVSVLSIVPSPNESSKNAPLGSDSLSHSVSPSSSTSSLIIVTRTFSPVTPGSKVSVPLVWM